MHNKEGRLTTRYSPIPLSSRSTRISLHNSTRSFRPLFAFVRTPSFRSFRGPRWCVGSVRSRRLNDVETKRCISSTESEWDEHKAEATYTFPIRSSLLTSPSLARLSCSRIVSFTSSNIRSAHASAFAINSRSACSDGKESVSWGGGVGGGVENDSRIGVGGSVNCMTCRMSKGYRVRRCTDK